MSTPETAKKCADIGKRLQKERESLGYTSQERFAAAISRSKRTVTNWELGDSAPDAADLRLMWKLGLDVSYILIGVRGAIRANDAATLAYATPSKRAADAISELSLSIEDSDMVTALARRLATKK